MKKTKKKLKTKQKMLFVIVTALVLIILILTIGFRVKDYTDDRPYYFGVTDDISIRYAYSLGVPTAEARNAQQEFMDILNFKLEGNNLKKMQKLLKTYSFHLDKERESVGVAGEYELIIGDEKVYIDQELALYTKDSKKFYLIDVTTELYDLVSDITWEVLEKNFTPLKANEITVTGREGSTTFQDKERVQELCNLFRFHSLKSYEEGLGEPLYTLDFKNGKVITVYDQNIGSYKDGDKTSYVIFYTDPRENIRVLFNAKLEEDEDMLYKEKYGG